MFINFRDRYGKKNNINTYVNQFIIIKAYIGEC